MTQVVMTQATLDARARVEKLAADSVCAAFAETVRGLGPEPALRTLQPDGHWRELSWDTYADLACRVAAGLGRLGLRPGERVGLMLRNRPEFHAADMGTMLARGTTVSIYNSSPPEQIRALLAHCGAAIAVVEDTFLDRLLAVRDQLPGLRTVIVVGDRALPAGVIGWEAFLDATPVSLRAAVEAVAPRDIATIIYTSGTTGPPKGVLHSQRSVAVNVAMFAELFGSLRGLRAISYLPMAHIAERLSTHYLHVTQATVVSCCPDLDELPAVMREIHPGWWFCAPRMWEKLRAGIETHAGRDPVTADAFRAARELGARVRAQGQQVDAELAAAFEHARRTVIAPLLAPLGLDQVRIAATGSAPMPRDTHEFFLDYGLPLSDAYGQSECPGISWDLHDVVPGTSGKPFPGVEVRLAEDGEILARGPNMFDGYLDDPDATAAALDTDGWLHTGDLGRFDEAGNLSVIDRKKEIIVCSTGHNVSPVQAEAALRESALIAQACVVGHGRPFVAALLVLDPEATAALARDHGLDRLTLAALAAHPTIRAAIEREVSAANQRFPRAEHVRAFHLLGEEWLPDTDVLTPTAKLKRRGIATRYHAQIDALYSTALYSPGARS